MTVAVTQRAERGPHVHPRRPSSAPASATPSNGTTGPSTPLSPPSSPASCSASRPGSAVLSTLAIFAVGFVARPFGGFLFGWIGDRVGRKASMTLAVGLASLGSLMIGVAPTFASRRRLGVPDAAGGPAGPGPGPRRRAAVVADLPVGDGPQGAPRILGHADLHLGHRGHPVRHAAGRGPEHDADRRGHERLGLADPVPAGRGDGPVRAGHAVPAARDRGVRGRVRQRRSAPRSGRRLSGTASRPCRSSA